MDKDEIRKYQLSQLCLAKELDRVCGKLSLKYYLIAGTLLGAVRHGGFIPWDADMDVAMPRGDYMRLREYYKSPDDASAPFFLQDYTTEKNHFSGHAKLLVKGTHVRYRAAGDDRFKPANDGIYMDIFPLDAPPEGEAAQARQAAALSRIKTLKKLKRARIYGKNSPVKRLAKRVASFLLLPFSFRFLNKREERVMSKYQGCGAPYLVSMASHYSYKKQCMPEDFYGTPVRVEFEGLSLCAPAKTHEYLTRLYGDYMTPPPETGRYAYFDGIAEIDYGTTEEI